MGIRVCIQIQGDKDPLHSTVEFVDEGSMSRHRLGQLIAEAAKAVDNFVVPDGTIGDGIRSIDPTLIEEPKQ